MNTRLLVLDASSKVYYRTGLVIYQEFLIYNPYLYMGTCFRNACVSCGLIFSKVVASGLLPQQPEARAYLNLLSEERAIGSGMIESAVKQ